MVDSSPRAGGKIWREAEKGAGTVRIFIFKNIREKGMDLERLPVFIGDEEQS